MFLNWSALGIIFNIIIYIIMILLMSPYYHKPQVDSNNRNKAIFLLFFTFCIFPLYSPDTFAYFKYFKLIKHGVQNVPIEQIYFELIHSIDSFIIFRLIIWGTAAICVWYMLKYLKVNKGSYFLFFIGLLLLKYSYARVFIVFALVFWGLALFYKNRSNVISKLLSILIICSSLFFHKSALFGVSIAFIAILLPPFKKRSIQLLLLSYPILIIIAKLVIENFLDTSFNENDLAENTAKYYLAADNRELGVGKIIENLLTRFVFYASGYLYIKMIFNGNITQLPLRIQKFATVGFLIVFVATIFAFDLGYGTQVFYYRLLHFAIIPVSVFLGYLFQIQYRNNFLRVTWKIGFVGCTYSFLYTLYNALLLP